MGMVMLRSMSLIMLPPPVSKPIDKRVTSSSIKSCNCEDPSPVRLAACTAAPKSSAKGVYHRHDSLDGCRLETLHLHLHGADGVLIVHEHEHQNHGERKSNSRPHRNVIGEPALSSGRHLVGSLLQRHFCACCRRCCCGCLYLLLEVEGGRQSVGCCFLFSPLSPVLISPFLSLRPVLSRALPARLSWLLATLFDGLAPSVCVGRCPYGPTKRLSTMSWVYSTQHYLRALNSLPSLLQRIPLALSSLLFHRALPGPQLLFLLFAPPELFLLSRDFVARLEHSLLSLAPPEPLLPTLASPVLSSVPLAPPALCSLLPHAPPALSSLLLCSVLFLFLPYVFAFFSLLQTPWFLARQLFLPSLLLCLLLFLLFSLFFLLSFIVLTVNHLIPCVSCLSRTDMAWGCEPPAPTLGATRPRCPSWSSSSFCIISTNFLTSSLWFS